MKITSVIKKYWKNKNKNFTGGKYSLVLFYLKVNFSRDNLPGEVKFTGVNKRGYTGVKTNTTCTKIITCPSSGL